MTNMGQCYSLWLTVLLQALSLLPRELKFLMYLHHQKNILVRSFPIKTLNRYQPRPPKHQHCRHKLQILVSSHKKKAIITDLFKVKDERVEINLLGEEQVFFATFILFWKSSLANFQVLHNTCKIKVVEEKSQDQRKDLYENEKSKADLVEEAMSLMESSKTHFKSLRSPKNAKEMDIDTSWEKLRN
ncbi:uncharacterized protein LOC112097243 [Citrus clementina]|uniref:uncharacterized protein LOC112097243 n=1 Tax=Citrus clementina TaxID=85681 RepID=UPI000CED6BBA|nr:uncharacterized protein LOC112097243 [Citrus x clementina]